MSILSQQKQSVNTDFPNVRPSLDLRFALAKKLDPRVTFSRGSTGTYFGSDGLMRTAAANEPRFDHDPVTGQSLGLLIEESRTNLIIQSEAFNTGWLLAGATVGVNSATAPDGTSNADAALEDGTNGQHTVYRDVTTSPSDIYTASCFIKAGTKTYGEIFINGGGAAGSGTVAARFDLTNLTVTSIGNLTLQSSSITPYPNSWYRCSITGSVGGSGSVVRYHVRPSTVSTGNYQGINGNVGIYIWGAQLEAGSFPTSYIPTSGSTVTRSADTATMTGTNFSSFFNSTEGTLCVDSEMPYGTLNRFPAIGFSNNGGSGNTIQFFYYYVGSFTTPYIVYLVRNFADASGGGAAAANLIESPSPTQTVGSYKKFIGTYKFGELNYYFDGKFVARTTTNKRLPTVNLMEIGNNGATVDRMNGHIRRITYYPIALTNQQLINLTS